MAKAIKTAIIATFIVVTGAAIGGMFGASAAASFGASFSAAFSAYAATTFATTLIAGAIGQLTSKGINANAGNFGSKFSTRQAVAPRQIIYGKCRVGGTIAHIQTTGTDNYLLHMVIVVAGHEVEDIETVRINDVDLTTTTSTISGSTVYTTTNADFTNTDNDNNFGSGRLIRYTKKLGTDTQGVDGFMDAQLASMTTDHRFRSCAYIYLQMVFDAEKFGGGVPAVSCIVKGKKVYDPRTSTTVWSDNPALCIRDYLTDTVYGLKATSTEINDGSGAGGFVSAANTCEQTVTLADNVTTEERYTANGFTNMSATGSGILEGLLSACAGKLSYVNGKFNVFVGASQTPSLTITDENLLQPVTVTTNKNTGDLYNIVKPVFVDSTQNYSATDAPILKDTNLLAEDTPSGEQSANYEKQFEPQLPYTVTHTMAQRLGKIQLLHQRQTTTISCLVDTKFLRLQPNDWVYVTNSRLSYTNKTFEVVSMNLELIGDEVPIVAVRLNLKEIDNAVYGYVYNEYSTPIDEGSDEETGDFALNVPTSLALTQEANKDSTTTKTDIKATWTNVVSDRVMGTEVTWKLSTEGTYSGSTVVGKNVTFARIPNVVSGKTYNVKVRHFATNNVFSNYTSAVNLAITKPTDPPSTPSSFAATSGNPLFIKVSWINPNNSDLRAVKVHLRTTNTTPTSDATVVTTISGEPNKLSTVMFGKGDGLSAGTTYYFWVVAVNHSDVESSISSVATGSFTEIEATDIDLPDFSGYFHVDDANTTNALTDAQFNTRFGRDPLDDDILVMVNTSSSPETSKAYKYDSGSFVEVTNFQTGDLIIDGTLAAAKIVAGSIGADRIAANAITAQKIAANAVTANKINANAVEADKIAANAITAVKIAADAVTGAKISSSTTITAGSGTDVGVLDGADATYRIYAGHSTPASAPFRVTKAGAVTATNATITGAITATSGSFTGSVTSTSGTIGGFSISSNYLRAGSGTTRISMSTADGIHLGNNTFSSAPFRVSLAGALTATNATITGNITASTLDVSSATITGNISADNISIDGVTLDTDGSGNLIVRNGGVDSDQLANLGVTTAKVNTSAISGFVAATGSQYQDFNDNYPDGSASETRLGYAYSQGTGSGGTIYFPNEAVMVETGVMLTPSSGTTSIIVIGHTINNVDAASSSDFITLRLQYRKASTSGGVSSATYSDVRLYTMYGASAESFQTLTGTVPSAFTSNNTYYQFRLTMRSGGVTTLAGTTRTYGPATVMALTTVK